MQNLTDRGSFLNLAALLEGGLILLAIGLGWFVEVSPLDSLNWSWTAIFWGTIATIPLLLVFFVTNRFPVGPFRPIKRFLIEMLGPSLNACHWYDLLMLSLLVGFSEELLFRGVLQPWFTNLWGPTAGLVISNILFGLAHFITPMYALLAAVLGAYLGVLLNQTGEPNVFIPMLTHALYDFVAFMVVKKEYQSEQTSANQPPTTSHDNGEDE